MIFNSPSNHHNFKINLVYRLFWVKLIVNLIGNITFVLLTWNMLNSVYQFLVNKNVSFVNAFTAFESVGDVDF